MWPAHSVQLGVLIFHSGKYELFVLSSEIFETVEKHLGDEEILSCHVPVFFFLTGIILHTLYLFVMSKGFMSWYILILIFHYKTLTNMFVIDLIDVNWAMQAYFRHQVHYSALTPYCPVDMEIRLNGICVLLNPISGFCVMDYLVLLFAFLPRERYKASDQHMATYLHYYKLYAEIALKIFVFWSVL